MRLSAGSVPQLCQGQQTADNFLYGTLAVAAVLRVRGLPLGPHPPDGVLRGWADEGPRGPKIISDNEITSM